MIGFCFGPNTTLYAVASRILVEVFKENFGEIVTSSISKFDEFRDLVLNNTSRNVILTGNIPEPNITEVIRRSSAVKIVMTQEPVSVISELMSLYKMDLLSAVRIHSHHYASMDALVGAADVHIVSLGQERRRPLSLLRSLQEIFGDQMNWEKAEAAVRRLYGDATDLASLDMSMNADVDRLSKDLRDSLDIRDLQAIDIAFPPIQSLPDYGMRWPSRFFYGPTAETRADEPIHLLGKSRTIFFGPFMYLAPGDWRATYKINIARNWSGNVVLADILANLATLAVGKLALPKEGSFEFSLDFTIPQEISPVEMRLHLLEGAIQGYLEMVDVQLSRI